MTGTHKLAVAYFHDWMDPTLLIWDGGEGLLRLSTLLEELATTGAGLSLSDLPWVRTPETFEIRIEIGLPETGLKRQTGHSGDRFEWHLSPATARHYAAVVRGVAENDKPCHNYLDHDYLDSDTPGDDIDIRVSKGEYGPGSMTDAILDS